MHDKINQLSTSMDTHKQKVADHIKELSDNLQSYVDLEVGRLVSQIQDIETKVNNLETKVVEEYDPDVTVIVTKVPFNEGENAQGIVEGIIREGLGIPDVPVIRAKRLPPREARGQRQPGLPLLKIELPNLENKIRVLRAKKRLENSEEWKRCWIRSSKSHVERLIDLNFKTMLDMIPNGNTMAITGGGRIIKRND